MSGGRTAVDLGRVGRLVRWVGGVAFGVAAVGFVGHEAIYADDPSPVSARSGEAAPDDSDRQPDPDAPDEAAWTTIRIKGFRFEAPATVTASSDATLGIWNRTWSYDVPPDLALDVAVLRSGLAGPVSEDMLHEVMLEVLPNASLGDIRRVEGPGTINLANRSRSGGFLSNVLVMAQGRWVVVVFDVTAGRTASPEFQRVVESFRFPG